MLHLHFANRTEALEERLLAQLAADRGGDPFEETPVIVAQAGMRRRLALAIADAHGVCAGIGFGYLAQWLWRLVARVVPGVGDESPFAAQALAWRVWALLGDTAFVAAQPRLAAWLGAADERGRFELAQRVAALIERYVTYRPDWLQAWSAGRGATVDAPDFALDEVWQAALWRRIVGTDAEAAHPRQAFAAALRGDGAGLVARGVLPRRAHVFALPTIAPLHLQMLQQLAAQVDVHLYAWNPCREYWGLVVDERRAARLAAAGRDAGHEVGHRLLASWGAQPQAQLEALLAVEGADETAQYAASGGTSLLARLQDSVLGLSEIVPGSLPLAEGDRSVEVHRCHSLRREVEVLHDQLLARFAAEPGLRPCDVVVFAPDLEAAAPLVDAVFGTAPAERRIPYTFARRARSRANLPARALLGVLDAAASRAPASALFALLQEPPVARRFGLDDDALASLRGWLPGSGYRWGLDDDQVAAAGLPVPTRHTLDDALQRLYLGFALPDGSDAVFAGQWPAPAAEGRDALPLGALWHFGRRLRDVRGLLQRPQAPDEWARILGTLIDDFVDADDDTLDDLRELQRTIAEVVDDMQRGGVEQPVPLAALRRALQDRLDDPARGGVAGGSVTFAAVGELRGLPHRWVCAIGLDDGVFPRASRPAEFDLMALAPRPGDRRPRDDDRALMLEWLLAARDGLYFSHSGFGLRDAKPRPPSVLVAELLDVLVPAVADDPASADALARARARLVVEHPLQPFSIDAFRAGGDERRRGFDRELAEALRVGLARSRSTGPPVASAIGAAVGDDDADDDADDAGDDTSADGAQARFFAAPLPAPGPPWHTPTLAQLTRFFRNPCRDLLRRRLRIALPEPEDELDDDEPFVADAAARRALARRLMPALLRGVEGDALRELAAAGPELPGGALAEAVLDRELAALQRFAARVREATAAPCLPVHSVALGIDVAGEPWQLRTSFGELRPDGLVGWRFGAAQGTDAIDAWLQHLVLCASAPPGVEHRTRWLCTDSTLHLRPVDDAAQRLAALLAIHRRGLCEPLHFFVRTSWAFVRRGAAAARAVWQPGPQRAYAESADPAIRLALRGVAEALDGDFEALARAVFGPLLDHLAEEKAR